MFALVTLPNGDVVAGGAFTISGGVPCNGIARWNGSSWAPLGSGMSGGSASATVRALTRLPNGLLAAGGDFTTAGGVACDNIASWDGVTWSPLGSGMDARVSALARLPNGDLVAGGEFTVAGGVACNHIARWDGLVWSPFGSPFRNGMAGRLGYRGPWGPAVHALTTLPGGDLMAAGAFLVAGDQAAVDLARLSTPCPATAVSIATPCIGPAGPVTLTADTLPWCGSLFATTATGFLPNALAVGLIGFSQSTVPLTALTPLAIPGCDQLASQEAVWPIVPQGGVVTHALPIPNNVAFVGVQLFHQFLQAELSPQYQLTSLSASNALRTTTGAW